MVNADVVQKDIETALGEALEQAIDKAKEKISAATKKAPSKTYYPTTHAMDRISMRFGVDVSEVAAWVNDKMAKATFIKENKRGQSEYRNEGVRFIVDDKNGAIVTVYSEVSTNFLRPVLERELRKMHRKHTRKVRQMEHDQAEALAKYAEMAMNKAKARNPETRDLIAERMAEVWAIIEGYNMRIDREADEYKSKVRAVELIAG